MKKFIISFLKRGSIFASSGPIILAIVYVFLSANGVVETVTVETLIREILTSTLLAFIAAGVSAVYTVDRLHPALAGLIQGSVLFLDYIILYLVNGWLPFSWQTIAGFTVIFVAAFVIIWLIIYLIIRQNIKRMNSKLKAE